MKLAIARVLLDGVVATTAVDGVPLSCGVLSSVVEVSILACDCCVSLVLFSVADLLEPVQDKVLPFGWP